MAARATEGGHALRRQWRAFKNPRTHITKADTIIYRRAAPRHRAVALPRARRDPGRCRAQASHRLIEVWPYPDAGSWQGKRIVMIKGRRARKVRGSPHGDRCKRWGAPLNGVCQCALRACWMWCRIHSSGTDRSSSERWLERSSRPRPPIRMHQPHATDSLAQQHAGTAMRSHPSMIRAP
jgi:hypothetical protein